MFPGTLLAKKYKNSLTQSATHKEEFVALCVGIPSDTIDLWVSKITMWEIDRKNPNPYFHPLSGMTYH